MLTSLRPALCTGSYHLLSFSRALSISPLRDCESRKPGFAPQIASMPLEGPCSTEGRISVWPDISVQRPLLLDLAYLPVTTIETAEGGK
jgi:hypothetical protein